MKGIEKPKMIECVKMIVAMKGAKTERIKRAVGGVVQACLDWDQGMYYEARENMKWPLPDAFSGMNEEEMAGLRFCARLLNAARNELRDAEDGPSIPIPDATWEEGENLLLDMVTRPVNAT